MILELLGSAGFGTLLGGVFGYLSRREETKTLEMKLSHDRSMVDVRANAKIRLSKAKVEEIQVQGEQEVLTEEAKAFTRSQKTSVIGETVKAFIRPIILGVLMYQTYLVFTALERLTGGLESIPQDDLMGLYKIVILMITGVTSTAVTWYFAARSSKQFDKLLDKWA